MYNNKKALQKNAKGLSRSTSRPLLERFGTFCWGEFMEELRNIYKLKDLGTLPSSAINNF